MNFIGNCFKNYWIILGIVENYFFKYIEGLLNYIDNYSKLLLKYIENYWDLLLNLLKTIVEVYFELLLDYIEGFEDYYWISWRYIEGVYIIILCLLLVILKNVLLLNCM